MKLKAILSAGTLLMATAPCVANASAIVLGKCTSVTSSSGCLFLGNITGNANPLNINGYKFAQNYYNVYNNVVPSARPNITLNYLFDTDTTSGLITGGKGSSGTWSTPGYVIDYMAVKAGNYFSLYKIADLSSGTWSSADIPHGKNAKDLSHIVFFGSAAVAGVPEPATWGMMIAGVGMAGGALRRRRNRQVTFAAA
ncbi:PEPxxWA-CTERM sorting domain-containing protein [Sphingomonas azotifigens]|uniref:PEPxxWA-CTERM sorting domain-containing protein n=1 Tax=Sphingomonas azotifigens TaxID=330920 RepID=UPI001FE55F72|nr:PEPxxWA-CTERM sorting domain-containing protein [Sphingomonas azotifigens]